MFPVIADAMLLLPAASEPELPVICEMGSRYELNNLWYYIIYNTELLRHGCKYNPQASFLNFPLHIYYLFASFSFHPYHEGQYIFHTRRLNWDYNVGGMAVGHVRGYDILKCLLLCSGKICFGQGKVREF